MTISGCISDEIYLKPFKLYHLKVLTRYKITDRFPYKQKRRQGENGEEKSSRP